MSKGKCLSEAGKAPINFLRGLGLSNRNIAKEIGRSHNVVNNFISKGENYGNKYATNGNKKISSRKKNQLIALASTGKLNANGMIQELDLPIKKQRVCDILSSSGFFKYTKRMKTPSLKPQHVEARLRWARNYMSWSTEWTNVVLLYPYIV